MSEPNPSQVNATIRCRPCPKCKAQFGMSPVLEGSHLAVQCLCGFRGPEIWCPPTKRNQTKQTAAFNGWNRFPLWLVREVNWAGPCIDLGSLAHETQKFYAIRDGRKRRILKTSAHIVPCQRCVDHPETSYPNGFDL